MPTWLESFSFFFHFSSCIVGPSIEFSDYKKFIYQTHEYENLDVVKIVKYSVSSLGLWLVYTLIFLVGNIYFPIAYTLTEEFGEHNIIYRFFYIYASANILRSMYFSGWKLAHTSMCFTGLTYSQSILKGCIVSEDFNKGICFDYWGVEIEPNAKKKITVRFIRL